MSIVPINLANLIPPVKARIVCLEVSGLDLTFPYNPKELTIKRQSGFTSHDKGAGPWGGIQWQCAKPDELSFDVVIDYSELPEAAMLAGGLAPPIQAAAMASELIPLSALKDIVTLHKMTLPYFTDSSKTYKRPPFCAFLWGDLQFYGGIQDISSKCVLFSSLGQPRRAEVSISMIGQAFYAPKDFAELTGAETKFSFKTLEASATGRFLEIKASGDPRAAVLPQATIS